MRSAFDEPLGLAAPALYYNFNLTISNVGISFDDDISLATNAALVNYWSAVFTDAHQELVDCWDTIVNAYEMGWITEGELDTYATAMGTPVTVQDPDTLVMRSSHLHTLRR